MRSDAAAITDRSQFRQTALGYLAETFPLSCVTATTSVTVQNLRACAVGLRAGDVVTNIVVCVTTAAAGTAGVVNVGLLNSAYGKLAISGDVNASLTATGVVALALTAPFTITADGLYYPVVLVTTAYGTTQPSLASGGVTGASVALAGKPKPQWFQSGQSSIPTTATPADTAVGLWFAVN